MLKIFSLLVILLVTACTPVIPQVSAEERMFLNLSLEFVGEYQLPKTTVGNTKVGGISAIAYNPRKGNYLLLSDDRTQPRFYTADITITNKIPKVNIQSVTFLKGKQSEDTEGIAISANNTIFISSEGFAKEGVPPAIMEYDVQGNPINSVKIPFRYLPSDTQGIRNNVGFESLTLSPPTLPGDPYRLFTATESSLLQDTNPKELQARLRFLHYVINPIGAPILVAEHLYLLESGKEDSLYNGLCEILALKREGFLLSLERTLSLSSGFGAKIFQITTGDATDTKTISSFKGDISKITPIRKKLLLDLSSLGITLDNLEGMTLGPRLADGSQSLILVSDNNFKDQQVTQFLLFKFK